MSKLVVSISYDSGIYNPGTLLVRGLSLDSQISRMLSLKKEHRVDACDEELASKMMQIHDLEVKFEPSGYYLMTGEPRLMPYDQKLNNVGFANPTEKCFGVYELCFQLSEYPDRGNLDKSRFAINSCHVLYHFPENKQADWWNYRLTGLKKCFDSLSEVCKYTGAREWLVLPVFRLINDGQFYIDHDLFKIELIEGVELGWKSFFTELSKQKCDNSILKKILA